MNPRRRLRLRQQKKHPSWVAVADVWDEGLGAMVPDARPARKALSNIRRVAVPASQLFAGFE